MPDWRPQAAASWKLTLPCTRAEAERLARDVPEIDALPDPPVLMTSEPDAHAPDAWRLDAYFEGEPEAGLVALVRSLVPSGADAAAVPEPVEDQDWTVVSQAFLTPIRAGRFHVHTMAHADEAPAGATAFRIEAGRAFGTGHHETTRGCLETLDALATAGHRFARIADIGTGTGLLAMAARALWPEARVLAADIDPVAIEVAAGVLADNGMASVAATAADPPAGAIALVAAPGVDHPAIRAAAPFDLLIANILAGPLIGLAPSFAAAAAPGGRVLLAGLLAGQQEAVVAAYAAHGFAAAGARTLGDWPAVLLVRPDPALPAVVDAGSTAARMDAGVDADG